MLKKTILILLIGALVLGGCAFGNSVKEYRTEKIRMQHPDWDDDTVQKTAMRKVEIGMSADMVAAALGKPDAISRDGEEEKWGYAVDDMSGWNLRRTFVYFVYLKDGMVVRTEGDRRALATLSWHE